MSNRWIAIIASVLTVIISTLSVAFAVEPDNSTGDTGSEEAVVTYSEPSEEVIYISDPVNISDDSIQAIVDAFNAEEEVVSYNVSFETGFSDLNIPDQESTDLSLPSLTSDGYSFSGWYTDPYFINRFSSADDISSDITLYAKWQVGEPIDNFTSSIFDGLTMLFQSPVILYLISLMGLVLIIGIIKIFVSTRY